MKLTEWSGVFTGTLTKKSLQNMLSNRCFAIFMKLWTYISKRLTPVHSSVESLNNIHPSPVGGDNAPLRRLTNCIEYTEDRSQRLIGSIGYLKVFATSNNGAILCSSQLR